MGKVKKCSKCAGWEECPNRIGENCIPPKKDLQHHGEPIAKLKDGTYQALYYGDGKGGLNYNEPRMFYKKGKKWFLDHDVYKNGMIIYRCDEIIAFCTFEDLKRK